MKYRMSEGLTNIGTPLREAMERTPQHKEPDGSLINEGTKTKQEQGEPVAYLVKHFQGDEQVLKANSDVMPVFFKSPEHFTCEPLYTTPQPKQEQGEPVGEVISSDTHALGQQMIAVDTPIEVGTVLYTTPQQRTWVGLTDEEYQELLDLTDFYNFPEDLITNTQAKLREKNT